MTAAWVAAEDIAPGAGPEQGRRPVLGGQNDSRQPPHDGAESFAPFLYSPLHPRPQPLSAISDSRQVAQDQLVNGMRVHHPKDLSKAANRAVLFAETRFPPTFQMAKRAVIKIITR